VHQPTLDVRIMAAALGGDVTGPDSVLAPGPGHSPKDRSMSVKSAPGAPDGFTVHSHAGDDWRDCKAYAREKLGFAPWEPPAREKSKHGNRQSQTPRTKVAEYVYRLEDGTPHLKVVRYEWMEGGERRKSFPQYHWTGSEWVKEAPEGPKIPYRLPELLAAPIGPVFVAEGEKDADALGRLGLIGTSASEGAGKWTSDLAKWFAGRTVYVLPDNDEKGRDHASKVAAHLHGAAREIRVVALPGLPEKGDVSDWIAADGKVEELLRLCEAAPLWAPECEPAAEARDLEWFDDLEPVLSSRYLIKGLLDVGAMSLVFGPPGSAKTFFVMDLAFHLAAGRQWRGRRIRRSAVLYLAAEGGSGAANRIAALRVTYGAHSVPFALRRAGLDLLQDDVDLQKVCALAREVMDRFPGLPLLIVVDTLSRAMAGGDENAAGDMTALIRNLDTIREATGAHVMVVHHAGKDSAKGARGHSSLRAATDTEIELTTEGNLRVAKVSKQRDNPGDEEFAFTLRSVQLGLDEDGDMVSSCVVEESDEAPKARKPRLTGQPLIAMQALGDALADHGRIVRGEAFPTNRHCVTLEQWREYCDRHSLSSGDGRSSRRTAFHKAKTKLHEEGLVRIVDGFAWRCEE
jgi:hypothetical protein